MKLCVNSLSGLISYYKELCVFPDETFLKKIKIQDIKEVSSRTVYYWKSGEKPISLKKIIKLCEDYNVKYIKIKGISVNGGNKIEILHEDKPVFYYFLGLLLGDGCLMISKDKGGKKIIRYANKLL